MASLYIHDELDPATAAVGSVVVVTGPEARHAVQVSRMRVGEKIQVGNGRGFTVTGRLLGAEVSELRVEVDYVRTEPGSTPRIRLVQALAKGDRDEMAVQAATELGVDAVTPWAAERSVSRWDGPKQAKGRARWQAIVREASKQSLRSWIPDVDPIVTTGRLAELAGRSTMLVLVPDAQESLLRIDRQQLAGASELVLVVGPEGGMTPAEIATLSDAGARSVRLGGNVMRTSTAGPAALAVLNAVTGRWQ